MTERERIAWAMLDMKRADELCGGEFADMECRVVAEAIVAAKERGLGAESVLAIVLEGVEWITDVVRLGAIKSVTRPNAAWFRELMEGVTNER